MKRLTKSRKELISIIINIFLVISTIIVTYFTVAFGTVASQVDTGVNYGVFYFATFTVDSNIFMGIVAAVAAIFAIINKTKSHPVPKTLNTWYLTATTSVVLTFLTVVFFLSPLRVAAGHNYFDMMRGPMFFFHFFNPVIAAINFVFFMGSPKLPKKANFYSLIPIVIYAVPYILNVVILKTWIDFYNFTFGGNNILVLPVFCIIGLIVFGISSLLSYCHNRQTAIK